MCMKKWTRANASERLSTSMKNCLGIITQWLWTHITWVIFFPFQTLCRFLKIWRFFCMNHKTVRNGVSFESNRVNGAQRNEQKKKENTETVQLHAKENWKRGDNIFKSYRQLRQANEWKEQEHARATSSQAKESHDMKVNMLLCLHDFFCSWVGRLRETRVCVCKNAVGQCV